MTSAQEGRFTVALVGRPNVGKSTLFNRLCGGRNALVHDRPGLTRDRQYGQMVVGEKRLTLIDTGGLYDGSDMAQLMTDQVYLAVDEADFVLFLVDGRSGVTQADEVIAEHLRRRDTDLAVLVNKVDRDDANSAIIDFLGFGFDRVMAVSAAHGRGIAELTNSLSELVGEDSDVIDGAGIPIAVIGRPNVGKSTLVNTIVGNQQQIVSAEPGTTRDAINVPVHRDGVDYNFIDTAGVRRKGRVSDVIEKFSIVKTLSAMDRSYVALLLVDAREGLVDQDLHLLEYAADAGTGVILLVNKWDGLDIEHRQWVKAETQRRLRVASWIPVHFVSALYGSGVGELFVDIQRVNKAGAFDVKTPELTRVLENAVSDHPPHSVRGRTIKLRYAHKVGGHPPSILIHGNRTEALQPSYVRYLENRFRDVFDLTGLPVRLRFRSSDNPFKGRRNELNRRQLKQRQRLIRHSRKR
ncbi:MAG: ribosome biogenesis GTPase Der [Pseudomonadales bacterium]|nr:ribosome biogenesis GTPase Der [Pseudomonadales bacterium]